MPRMVLHRTIARGSRLLMKRELVPFFALALAVAAVAERSSQSASPGADAVSRTPTPGTAARATTPTTTRAQDPDGPSRPTLRTTRQDRFLALHESFLKRGKEGPIDIVFLGDSITERWTSAPQVWNRYLGKWKAANFGIGGDRTQHVLWRVENGELDGIKPRVLVLMIGTNNANSDAPDSIARAVTRIVHKVREKLPDTKILLLGIFPRAPRPKDMGKPMERIREVNPQLARLDDGKMIRYLDIGDRFLVDGQVPKDVMPDGVHLSERGYEIWAKAMQPLLEEVMAGATPTPGADGTTTR